MEADEGENPELANLQLDEEKDEQEIAAAAREVRKVILSRMKFMRRIGRPLTLMRTKEPNGSAYPSRSQKQLRSHRHEQVRTLLL
jgi:hypothetical protein